MRVLGLLLAAGLWVGTSFGQQAAGTAATAAAGAPKGTTGQCNDGTYTKAEKKWQACAGHKGVKSWFAGAGTTAGDPPNGAAKGGTPAGPAARAAATQAAPGGGPGMVWVNLDSKVYHCPGGTFYGKTKNGKYMTEADAQKMGAKPLRGKACAK